MPITRTCRQCHEDKPMDEFEKHISRSGGRDRRHTCKVCRNTRKRELFLNANTKYVKYKQSAKERNYAFDLTFDEFLTFWQKPCSYCNREIATIGIDRVDNTIGYVLVNCVSCCSICNSMKMDTPEEEWYSNMLTVLKHKGII